MPITTRDEELLNQAFSGLSDTLLRNRMMKAEQSRQQQEQQRLEQNAAATQQFRQEELQQRGEQQQILDELASARLAETQKKDEQTDTNAKNKEKTTLYNKNGEAVTIPSPKVDDFKKNYAATHPGDQLSETNPFYKELNVAGQTLGYTSQKEYDAAVIKLQEQQQLQQQKNAPKTVTRVIKGTQGGLPIDETNTTTTATSPMSMSGAVPTARVRVKSPTGQIGSIPSNQLQDALSQGYTQVGQ